MLGPCLLLLLSINNIAAENIRRSEVASNQCIALQHIASLALDDPVFRTFFIEHGALEFLLNLKPRIARCDRMHRDLLLSWSRRALISLSQVEVNTLGQQLHRLIDTCSGRWPSEGHRTLAFRIAQDLCKYLK